MTRDLDRKLASNKQLRKLEFIQADGGGREDASLSAINERGETSGSNERFIGKTTNYVYMYMC